MGCDRAGRRIKIVVHEKCGQLKEFPLLSTGWKRPANAFEDLVEQLLDAGITNDMVVYHSVVRYRLNRIGKNLEKKPTTNNVLVGSKVDSNLASGDSL